MMTALATLSGSIQSKSYVAHVGGHGEARRQDEGHARLGAVAGAARRASRRARRARRAGRHRRRATWSTAGGPRLPGTPGTGSAGTAPLPPGASAGRSGSRSRRRPASSSCGSRSKAWTAPGRWIARTGTIEVPDLTAPQVAISTPRVFRVRTARDLQALAADGNATPVISREFSRTERLG